jgi:hypothetical protein
MPRRSAFNAVALGALLAALAAASAQAVERETSYVYPPFKHTLGMQRVGELELKLFLGPGARIDNPQGLAAGKPESRDDPKTERDDDELNLFLVNAGRGELIYNPSQTSLKRFGKRGSGEGEFADPRGIAVDRSGLVVVADTGNRRLALLRLGSDGLVWERAVTSADGPISPTAVAVAGGLLWVTDFAGDRILRYQLDGQWLDAWPLAGGEGLDGPLALAVQAKGDPWNQSGRFTLAVVDEGGARLSCFDEAGALRAQARVGELLPGPASLGYPVIDLHGQLLLPDSTGNRLLKVDGKLRVLDIIDHIDDDERPLQHPNSLALYRRFGQLFIVEARGGSYAWTGTEISELRVTRVDGQGQPGLQLDYRLSEPSLVSVELLTGGTARELMPARRRGAGERREWLALPADADPQALLVVKAKPTYSAQQQLTVEQRLPLPPVGRSGETP